jgi:hypothetical protein
LATINTANTSAMIVALDPQLCQQLSGPRAGVTTTHPGELRGQQHVVPHGQVLEQDEELEDHPDLAAAKPCDPGLAHPIDPLAGDRDPPLVGLSSPAIRFSSVDLPLPDEPITATASHDSTVRLTSSRAGCPAASWRFVTPLRRITPVRAAGPCTGPTGGGVLVIGLRMWLGPA